MLRLILTGTLLLSGAVLANARIADAQQPPGIGYMVPAGGQIGQTSEVTLGGYDWTPDMQVFVHDERIKLEIISAPGPVLVPEPPYWFGKKARRSPFLLPREVKARLSIPAGVAPGLVRYQIANANGATQKGAFFVSSAPLVAEKDDRDEPLLLPELPVVAAGRIKSIEQVDTYRFTAQGDGPITCRLLAAALGSELTAALEIRDSDGRMLVDLADTAHRDLSCTFAGRSGETYAVRLYDVDFRGNRAFTYGLQLHPGPRVVAAIPARIPRGGTSTVRLIGYGLATGTAQLESVEREVQVPGDHPGTHYHYTCHTPHGPALPIALPLSEEQESTETAWSETPIAASVAVTGLIERQFGQDEYQLVGRKGDAWDIHVQATATSKPLDVDLAIFDSEGEQLAQNDDLPGTTDAGLLFRVPADGEYRMVVGDVSGRSGTAASVYRLSVAAAEPGFEFSLPEQLACPLGEETKLTIKFNRSGGCVEPIALKLSGLPAGVSVPDELVVPEKKSSLVIPVTVSDKAAAAASLVTVTAEAKLAEKTIRHTAGPMLLATTITPPFSIDAEGKNDVTKWPRGTTFPAPVLIEREEGFHVPIVLEMTSKQGRHRQGIRGPELTVPPGVERILYPVFLPEWLETTRTSRMVVNGVARVADPQGNLRYSVTRQKNRMGFLPTGALLKLDSQLSEIRVKPGETFNVPLLISRSRQLAEPARLELLTPEGPAAGFIGESQTVSPDASAATFAISAPADDSFRGGECILTIRATVMQQGKYPVVSEAKVLILFEQ